MRLGVTVSALHRFLPLLQKCQHRPILFDADQAVALGLEAPVQLSVDALEVNLLSPKGE
jgi:hypothetical protein